MKYSSFPLKIKQGPVKGIFFNLLEEKGMDMIAKKVSKMNGDLRVAFDLIKSAFVELYNRVKYRNGDLSEERKGDDDLPSDEKIRISMEIVIKVFNEKYSSKLPATLKCLPR